MMRASRLLWTLGLAMLMTATSTQAVSTAVLHGSSDGDALTLQWRLIGEADALTLHWADSSGESFTMELKADQTSVTVPMPDETTVYYLEITADGTVGYSNAYNSGPFDCHPQNWFSLFTSPPFIVIHWDCFL